MDSFRRQGMEFDVRDAGPADGEPVVLLHGFPQDRTAFDRVAPVLHAAGLRTLAPDQRGLLPGRPPSGRGATGCGRPAGRAGPARRRRPGVRARGRARLGRRVAWALGAWYPERVRTLTALSVPHPAALARALVTSDQALRSYYMALFQLPFLPERLLWPAGGGAPAMLAAAGCPDEAWTATCGGCGSRAR